MAELKLRSPVNGFIVEKIANIGEVVGAGMPVATLIDPDSLYLRLFVDTIENGKIELGDKAVIFTDAYPDRPIAASVVNIAQKAEFTPKEVSVRSDRIQRVFSVHLKPLHPDALLKLGLPAIGVISLDGKGLPDSLGEIPAL
jgi:HlyD family secretion protein